MRHVLIALFLSGCITHMPLRTREHLQIPWAQGFERASLRAADEHKPMLVLLIAGQIDGPC
jgi:hypothetical protein